MIQSNLKQEGQNICDISFQLLSLSSEKVNVKCKSVNGKPTCDSLFVGNSNFCPICHCLRDIDSQNVHDLELQNGARSNVNMLLERPHATSCVGNRYVCPICHHFRDIDSQNMHDLNLELQNGPRLNVNMLMGMLYYATFYLLTISIFSLSVMICEIFAIKMCMTWTLTFKTGQGQM